MRQVTDLEDQFVRELVDKYEVERPTKPTSILERLQINSRVKDNHTMRYPNGLMVTIFDRTEGEWEAATRREYDVFFNRRGKSRPGMTRTRRRFRVVRSPADGLFTVTRTR